MNQNNLKHDLKRPKDDLQQKKCCVKIVLPRWINNSAFSILSAEVFRYVYGDIFLLGVNTPEIFFGTFTADSVRFDDFTGISDLRFFFFPFSNRKFLRSESSESSEEFLSSDKESGLYSDSISEDKNSSYTVIFFLFPSSSSSEDFELLGLTGTWGGTIILSCSVILVTPSSNQSLRKRLV